MPWKFSIKPFTCAAPKNIKGNVFLVQYLQSFISMICPDVNYTTSRTHDLIICIFTFCYICLCFDFAEIKCEMKINKAFAYCHTYSRLKNSWSCQEELPQITKEVQEKIYTSLLGMKLKALNENI